jgi:hypothetical protein
MKRIAMFLLVGMIAAPGMAGVVYEIEVTGPDGSEMVSDSTFSVQDNLVKVVGADAGEKFNGEMIFRGDRREMLVVNHDEMSYLVMDEATITELAATMNEAMAAMEQALASVPEGQREKFRQMMQSKMPNAGAERVPTELRNTGDTDTIRGYPCVRYEVWRGGVRTRELWVTDWANVEGGDQVAAGFQEMADFFKQMLDSMSSMSNLGGFGEGFADSSFEHLREMNGFPVVSREYDENGAFEGMAALKSATVTPLDPETFEPPTNYKRQDLDMGGKKKKRKK